MHTYIVAEIGCNHNGDVNLAKKMIKIVAESGADAAKFQMFHAGMLASKNAGSAEYQKKNLSSNMSQYEMLKNLELNSDEMYECKQLCEEVGIDFFATPFDLASVDELEKMHVNKYKVGSGDVTDKRLLEKIGRTGKPVILATGMSTYDEISDAINWLEEEGPRNITLLHCTSNYPTSYEDVNMLMMDELREKYNRPVGYSDHTLGVEVPVMAVARGAVLIEKHVTLDNNMPGPDHKASLELTRLPEMVSMIRHIEKAFGSEHKQIIDAETDVKNVARKSLVATHNMDKGHIIIEDDFVAKRPGTGIEPKYLSCIIGKTLSRNMIEDDVLNKTDIREFL